MSTPAAAEPLTRTAARVVAGVDPDGHSVSAVGWAARETAATGGRLTLVTAYPSVRSLSMRPERFSPARLEADARHALEHLLLGLDVGRTETRIVVDAGTATQVLLDAALQADLLVVGRRALARGRRMAAPSTSVAVAGRAVVPTVVVPERWDRSGREQAPVVVGVALPSLLDLPEPHPSQPPGLPRQVPAPADTAVPAGPDVAVLDHAAAHADRLGVPLVVVSAWAVPRLYTHSPDDIAASGSRYDALLAALVAPVRSRHPDLEVATQTAAGTATDLLADAAREAQLVVVGRHTSDHHLGGFHIGSTARALLHHTGTPVAVVPGAQVPRR